MTLTEEQIQEIGKLYPGAASVKAGDGSYLITVPNVELPEGWNVKSTTVRFIAPVGYPQSKPDCFWTDPNLRLVGGLNPQNTGPNPLPNGPNPQLWFSWHTLRWSPNFDSLLTYLRVIKHRFLQVR
jgi:hypothetical protein